MSYPARAEGLVNSTYQDQQIMVVMIWGHSADPVNSWVILPETVPQKSVNNNQTISNINSNNSSNQEKTISPTTFPTPEPVDHAKTRRRVDPSNLEKKKNSRTNNRHNHKSNNKNNNNKSSINTNNRSNNKRYNNNNNNNKKASVTTTTTESAPIESPTQPPSSPSKRF